MLLAILQKVEFEPPFPLSSRRVKRLDLGKFELPTLVVSGSLLLSTRPMPLLIARSVSASSLAHSDPKRALEFGYRAILRCDLVECVPS